MSAFVKTGIAVVVGAGIGAASMEALRAQAKPPALVIAEVDIRNQDVYAKEFLPARAKAVAEAGGRYIVRGAQARAVVGQPPTARIVVVQFEDVDKLVAFAESKGFKDSEAIGEKYANLRIYAVKGLPDR